MTTKKALIFIGAFLVSDVLDFLFFCLFACLPVCLFACLQKHVPMRFMIQKIIKSFMAQTKTLPNWVAFIKSVMYQY
jgi:hypothetical protein